MSAGEPPETRYARALDGTAIAYQVVGDGSDDLLWLEGSARGNLEIMWEQPLVSSFFTRLASGCRVIRLDMRGTGLSDRGGQAPDFETQMDDARAVLDAVGSRRTFVVGHMWGSAAACLFATTFPGETAGLVLLATQARNRWADDYPWGLSETEWMRSMQLIEAGWGTEAYAAYDVSYSAPSMIADRDYIRWVAKMQRHTVGPTTVLALERQFYESDVTEVLRLVRVPTLVVARHWQDPEEDEYVAGLIPTAQLARLPGKDWTAWVGDQASAVDAVHTFVDGTSRQDVANAALATVMSTDIVGSTAAAAAVGDAAWRGTVEAHHATVRSLIEEHRGRVVDTAGDGFYATFDGPSRAVTCAQQIVRNVRPLGVEVRAGVHTGECVTIDGKVGGIAVMIGARIAALAGPSQVLVSQTVKDLTAGSGLSLEPAGEHQLKGIPSTWQLYNAAEPDSTP